jgi:hypothetical protein
LGDSLGKHVPSKEKRTQDLEAVHNYAR